MKNKLIMTLGAAMLIGSIVAVQAVPNPINGSISFSDDFTANGALNVATAITSLSNVKVSGTEGDYSGIATGTAVDFSAVTAGNPFDFSSGFNGLWKIVIGGTTYSFDVNTVVVGPNPRSTSILILSGTGTAHITGFDDTDGTWNLTLNKNGGLLNFSGGTTVPDGGMTVMLLGAALSGLGLIRKKFLA